MYGRDHGNLRSSSPAARVRHTGTLRWNTYSKTFHHSCTVCYVIFCLPRSNFSLYRSSSIFFSLWFSSLRIQMGYRSLVWLFLFSVIVLLVKTALLLVMFAAFFFFLRNGLWKCEVTSILIFFFHFYIFFIWTIALFSFLFTAFVLFGAFFVHIHMVYIHAKSPAQLPFFF